MPDHPLETLVEDFSRRKMTRREFFVRSLALGLSYTAAVALLEACAPPATPAPVSNVVPPPEQSTGKPRNGGTLVYGIHNELQPVDYVTSWMSEAAAVDIYEKMLALDPKDGKLVGWLAESFTTSDDGLKLTFRLPKGKKFHNGDLCDSKAVKALFDWWTDPKTDYTQPFFQAVKSVEAPDDATVVLNLSRIDTDALYGNTYIYAPIVNIAQRRANPDTWGKSVAIGTGPYKFKSWAGDTLETVRFDDYIGGPPFVGNHGKGYLDKITYRWLPDQVTRGINLEAGDFDIVEQPAPQDVARLEANPKITVVKRPAPAILYMGFNFKSTRLQDRRLREAIFHAIDRKPIIDQNMFGQASPAYSPVVPQDIAYWKDSEKLYPYDTKKAESLLDEAGYKVGSDGIRQKDGKTLELGIILLGTSEQKTVAQVVQQQLVKVGIKINLEVLDKGTHQARQSSGEYDINFFRYWYDSSIAVLKILYHSKRTPPNGANWAFYSNPQADKDFETFNTVNDLEKRKEAIIDVQKVLLQDVVQVPLFNPLDVWAMRKWVAGFNVQSYMAYNMHNDLWVTEESPRAKSA